MQRQHVQSTYVLTSTEAKKRASVVGWYRDQLGRKYVLNPDMETFTIVHTNADEGFEFPALDEVIYLFDPQNQTMSVLTVRETYLRSRARRLKHATLGVLLT